jgi:hypothetical protein
MNVNISPSDEKLVFNFSSSAAECPQHSLAEAERVFPEGPGVSRIMSGVNPTDIFTPCSAQ